MKYRGRKLPRYAVVLAICLAITMLLVPSGFAQQSPSAISVNQILYSQSSALPIASVQENTAVSDVCSSGQIVVDSASFDFSETDAVDGSALPSGPSAGSASTGCAEATLVLNHPEGASQFVFSFSADRRTGGFTGANTIERQMPQTLRHYDSAGALLSDTPYYDISSASQAMQGFNFTLTIPPGSNSSTVAWYFADDGLTVDQSTPSTGAAQSLAATVTNLGVSYTDLPWQDFELVDGGEQELVEEETIRSTTHVDVNFPDELAATEWSFRMRVSIGATFTALVAPDGTVRGPPDVPSVITTQSQEFTLSDDDTAAGGPGTYRFSFVSSRALILPPPTTVDWLPIAMSALPLLGAVFASRAVIKYRAEAKGTYVRGATLFLVATAVLIFYYAVAVWLTLVRFDRPPMITLPLGGLAIAMYIQLIGLAVIFLLLWQFGGRSMVKSMRADIEERKRQALELSRSNEDLERFAYIASHDLQEPLRKIASYTTLLKRRYHDKLDGDANEFIDYAVDGSMRMQELIQALLTYSRVGSGELEKTPTDSGKLVEQALMALESRIADSKAKVTHGELPTIPADGALLRQVFQNLIGNGLKFQDPKRKPKVHVEAVREGAMWRFTVQDNGIGIAQEHADKVFQMFQRLHSQKEFEGTGLGLALVKKIIERHDGAIGFDSTPGQGTTMWFLLPA